MEFENLTGWNEIGANCYVLDLQGSRILLDAGIHPKMEGNSSLPTFDRIDDNTADTIIISHSHLDHLGAIPVAHARHACATVFATPATIALADAMLHNSVNVMQSKRTEQGIVDYPFFTHQDLDRLIDTWVGKTYGSSFRVGSAGQVTVTFYDAGHILGSAGVMFEAGGQKIFYTGDVQFENQTVIPGASFPEGPVDTLIMETTRGAVERPAEYNRPAEQEKFCQAIRETLENGGAALVPVFALGKTQEVLTMIHQFKQAGKLPKSAPVYIGGLSTKVTKIFDDLASETPRIQPDFRILEEVDLIVASKKRKRAEISCQPGGIYVLSSGMMSEKTLSNKFARQVVSNPKNSLLFVGYADPDSPAGLIKELAPGAKFQLEQGGPSYHLDCRVESFDFSGHAPREALLQFAISVKPRRVMLVHGDQDALEWFEQQMRVALPEAEIIIPKAGQRYSLA